MQSWIEGETLPRDYTLYSSEDELQDLTGSLVELILTGSDGTILDTTGSVVIKGDPTLGVVTYTPTADHIQARYSPLSALFQVTGPVGAVGFFPSDGADEWHVYSARTAAPRYTFEDLRRMILRWLDAFEELNTGSDLDSFVKQQINDANADRASEYPWPFMRAEYDLPVTTDVRRYSMPGNLGRLLYIWSPADGQYLNRIPDRHLDDAGLRFDGTAGGGSYQPYDVRDRSLVLFGPPAHNETLKIGYFKAPAKMVNPGDLPNLPYPHSRLLVWDALLDLKSYANELSAIPLWKTKQELALVKLYAAFVDGQTLGEMPLSVKPGQENF